MKITELSPTPNQLSYIGSVEDVIAAKINPQLKNKKFHAKDFAYGFEIGSPKDWESLGETVLVNNLCFTQSTDSKSNHFGQAIYGEEFLTSGIFLIPHSAKANFSISFESLNPNTLLAFKDFYQNLYQKIQRPFAFISTVQFKNLSCNAIARPPIDGKPIFKNTSEYYFILPWDLSDQAAFMVGVVADFQDQSSNKINQQLSPVLYHNPFEESHSDNHNHSDNLTMHTHAITLKKFPNLDSQKNPIFKPDQVEKTVHVFSDQTLIQKIEGLVFMISDMKVPTQ